MKMLKIQVALLIVTCYVTGCGPHVDPDLRPYIRMKSAKDAEPFLRKPVDEQIEIYLRVASIPFKPSDYSLSAIIAVSNGDIGGPLSDRLNREQNVGNIDSLVRLAGQYCNLNISCHGEYKLEDAVKSAVERIPNWRQNPYTSQNVNWVSEGVKRATQP